MFIRRFLLQIFSHHTLALIRWDIHFILIRITNFILLTKRRIHKRVDKLDPSVYLNFGSGPRGIKDPAWINIDGFKDKNVDYLLDLSRSLPFPDNSFDGIFCEHVLEHFTIEDGRKILCECFRVLKPGGCIRIIVPDGKKIMQAYFDNPQELLERRSVDSSTPMEAVNSYFRQRYEHQIAYDSQLLGHQLSNTGFSNISEASYKKGDVSASIVLDDEKYQWESLYMEASKPGI